MMKKFKFLLAFLFSLTVLTSCGGKESSSSSPSSSTPSVTELSEEITNSTKLSQSFEGKSFLRDGIGEVTLDKTVDGDTTWFRDGSTSFSLRYYGINTPESTAKIEPWGRAASEFNKERINKATSIVLERDAAEIMDSNGRYIGLVWLKDAEHTDYYCLNLLLVEQAYSDNLLFDAESNYLDAFRTAGSNAKATGKRVHGEKDPTYDYSGTTYEISIQELLNDFEKYQSGASELRITGIVTRLSGDNFYIRDAEPQENEDGSLSYGSIYVFSGYSSGVASRIKVGDKVRFYCKAGEYNGQKQLTDPITSALGSKKMEILERGITIDPLTLTENDNLEEYMYEYVTAKVEVQEVKNPSENGDYTVIAKFVNSDIKIDVRVRKDLDPYYGDLFVVGNQLQVTGCLGKFVYDDYCYYQINLCNKVDGQSDVIKL